MPGPLARLANRIGLTPRRTQRLGIASPWRADDILSVVTLAELFELGDYIPVTRRNALTIGTIAAGRQVIAGTSGRLEHFVKINGARAPRQPALFQQPEPGIPRSISYTWLYDDLLFQPCAWWRVVERDYYDWPSKVLRVSPGNARLSADGSTITHDGSTPIAPRDVIRFDSPHGEGLLDRANKTIRRGMAIELAAALAEDNPVPAFELHNEGPDLDDAQIDALMERWTTRRKQTGVAYTSKNLKAIAHGQHTPQLLIEGRRALSLDLVRQMALPAWAASTAVDGATLTYDNRSLRNWELIDLTLAPFHQAVKDRLSMPDITPRGWQVDIDIDSLTRPDQKTRFETYNLGLEGGYITTDWIAAQEGWTPTTQETP